MNVIGQKFNRLTILERVPMHGTQYLKCVCDCGVIKTIKCSHVKSGATKSCGCFKKETLKRRRGESRYLKPDNYSAKRRLYLAYKHGAEARNLEFNLTMDELLTFVFKKCTYCNIDPYKVMKTNSRSKIIYNGIDRKNNDIGYNLENCTTCCIKCNIAKSDHSIEEFLKWIRQIYENTK